MKTIELNKAQQLVAEGIQLSEADRLKLQQERLQELVAYVRQHSPYFAKLYAQLPEQFNLTDLPITQKGELLENYNDWVTDRELHLEDVLAYLGRDVSLSNQLLHGKYTALRISGSSGHPLPMVRDDHRNKIHAQLIAQRLCRRMGPDVLNIRKNRVTTIIRTANGASSYEASKRMKQATPIAGKTFTAAALVTKAEVRPGLTSYQFVQTDDQTLELRGTCHTAYCLTDVLSGLCQQIQAYFIENNTPDAKVVYADKPFIPNKQGGKVPIYIKLEE